MAGPGTQAVPRENSACFIGRRGSCWFTRPKTVITAHAVAEILPALAEAQRSVEAGFTAAGFIAYEAAPAFAPELAAHPPADVPLVWLGIYERAAAAGPLPAEAPPPAQLDWRPLLSEAAYHEAFERIRTYIHAGDTYQVNYTFPLEAAFHSGAWDLFAALWRAQPTDHAAYIDTGRFSVASVSPELFFQLDGRHIATRPMKGTRRRGRWCAEDQARRAELAVSEKDRAENVMIVDLLRNDIGRICRMGSVVAPELFTVERYATVWQMTSLVAGETVAEVPEILHALFPCGSVTGAPKVRTMEIIRELEPFPRGIYCGAMGWWGPGRQAEFNVAIRTVTVDRERGTARYSTGGGITWGSDPAGEYEECQAKAAVLTASRPDFDLLETLRHDEDGYALLDRHIARLAASADYFDYAFDNAAVRAALKEAAVLWDAAPRRVRLLAGKEGSIRIEDALLPASRSWRMALASTPIDSGDVFLYHKTTHRQVYGEARANRPDCDDVLLWNERGEVTEATMGNFAADFGGGLVTPPLHCGLLAGTQRASWIESGRVHEAVIQVTDLARAKRMGILNSVRGWIDVEWIESKESGSA